MSPSTLPHRHLPPAYLSGFWSLITLLLLSSGPAYAEWMEIGGSKDFTPYADHETIRRKGNLVKMWELFDYKTLRHSANKAYLSVKYLNEYDCEEEKTRTIASYQYSDQMGKGDIVLSSTDPGKWEPVMPGSVARVTWKLACTKR